MQTFPMVQKRILPLFLFSVLIAESSTSAVRYSMPAAVELRVGNSGTCSGTIIGDAPLKVLTAEHCLANLTTGGVQILDPTAPIQIGKAKWINSSKVYLPSNPDYLLLVKEKYSLVLQIAELDLVLSMAQKKLRAMSLAAQPRGLLGELFAGPATPPDPEEVKKMGELLIKTVTERETLEQKLEFADESLRKRFADYDIAVLVFDVKLPGDLSVEQKIANRQVIPLARKEGRVKDIPVILGGYGLTGESQRQTIIGHPFGLEVSIPPKSSHFTTNTLSVHPKRNTMYTLYGNVQANLTKLKAPVGTLGAPLPGDSGSAVLSSEGIVAVTSSISFYSSHVPPTPDWVNTIEDKDDIVDRYDYIMAHFPSVTSPAAQSLFAEVEKGSGALVYADQVKEFASLFENEKLAIQAVGNNKGILNLFASPDLKVFELPALIE